MGQRLAKELGVVLPISFYEKKSIICTILLRVLMPMGRFLVFIGRLTFRMTIIIRKNFIFTPGDTGFRVFQTRFGTIWNWNLLGPVVSGNCKKHWHF